VELRTSNFVRTFTGPSEQKPIKTLKKREHARRIQGLPEFFGYPQLSQERVNLWTSNFAGRPTLTRFIRTKADKKFGEKGAWADPGTVQILGYNQLSQERVKLRTSNFVLQIHRIDWNKSPLKISGKVAVGVVRDSQKIFQGT